MGMLICELWLKEVEHEKLFSFWFWIIKYEVMSHVVNGKQCSARECYQILIHSKLELRWKNIVPNMQMFFYNFSN